MAEHQFKVGDRVYVIGGRAFDGLPDITGPLVVERVTPGRGDICLCGLKVKFRASGAEAGKADIWHGRRHIRPAEDPEVRAMVDDTLRQRHARKLAKEVDMEGEPVSAVRAHALAIVAACDKHLERWPEDEEEANG